jgi:hypothetical protein
VLERRFLEERRDEMEDEQGEKEGIDRKTADYWRFIFVIICGALIIGTIVMAVVRKLVE